MLPQQWAPPCGGHCTNKYAAIAQIPWRVFCKKGCDADGETWDECLGECEKICYKDPVLKDKQWSAYIDRSPGAASYSEECFHACVSGCGFKECGFFVCCSLKLTKKKLVRFIQIGHANLLSLRSHHLFRRGLRQLSNPVNLLRIYLALLHSK